MRSVSESASITTKSKERRKLEESKTWPRKHKNFTVLRASFTPSKGTRRRSR